MAWNRPSEEKKVEVEKRGGQRNVHLKGLVAGAIVVVGAAVAAWLLWPHAKRPLSTSTSTSTSLIKDVAPSVSTNAPAVAEAPVDPNADPPGTYRDEKGVLRQPGGMRVKDPKRNHIVVTPPDFLTRPPVFTNMADREIASLVSFRPGERVIGTPRKVDERFEKAFVEALLSGRQINPDDPPRVRQLKEDVYEAKREIAKRIKAGETLSDIIEGARQERVALAENREALLKELDGATLRNDLSDAEVGDFVRAANKMLSEKGMRTLDERSFLARRFYLQKKRQQKEAKEEAK